MTAREHADWKVVKGGFGRAVCFRALLRRFGEMMEAGKADRTSHGGDRRSNVSEQLLTPTLA
jgi:hypothetical protein